MRLDGLKSTSGANPADRLTGKSKAGPNSGPGGSAGAKSFGDAFAKAKAAGLPPPSAGPASVPQTASGPAPDPAAPPGDAADHIDTIRFRLQSGYYDNPKIADALSDKLSGYFDDVA